MRAGTLRELLTIEKSVPAQDSYGEPIDSWSNLATNPTVWGNVGSRASGERFISGAEQVVATVSHTVRIRYRDDVSPVRMRIKWRENRYLYIENVIDPDGRKSYLVLMCREEQEPVISTQYITFDGVDDLLTITAAAAINNLPTGDFTVEIVCKGMDSEIIRKAGNYGWYVSILSGNLAFVVSFDTGFYYAWVETSFDADNYHHYEFVFNASPREAKIFIDGTEATYSYDSIDADGSYDTDTSEDIVVFGTTNDDWASGEVRWLRISDVARHTSNFTAPSLTTAPDTDNDTVLLLAMEEGTGDPEDSSGNELATTLTGGTWATD